VLAMALKYIGFKLTVHVLKAFPTKMVLFLASFKCMFVPLSIGGKDGAD
jgi:hypothetical protein